MRGLPEEIHEDAGADRQGAQEDPVLSHIHHVKSPEEKAVEFRKIEQEEIAKFRESKKSSFVLLGISILCEVIATISLKFAEGFTVIGPSIITVAGYIIAFSLLVRILEKMPLGLVYGIWGGIGSLVTMLAGVIIWGDPLTPWMVLGIGLVVGGVYLLNSATDELEAQHIQYEHRFD